MKLPLQITFHGMEPSEALEAAAAKKAHKLEEFFADIMSCRVVIEQQQKHQHQGRPYAVRIDLSVPGHELCVNRVQDEDAYVALRDAFDDMKRQLEDVARRMRGQEKLHTVPLRGEVVRLDPEGRFGFIRTPEGDEYYFSRENLSDGTFDQVEIGAEVQFLPEVAAEGRQAKRVSFGKHHFE
jgi:ribosomal subunit interface protein